MAESGVKMQLVLATDSASAKVLLMKREPGRMRHLDVVALRRAAHEQDHRDDGWPRT